MTAAATATGAEHRRPGFGRVALGGILGGLIGTAAFGAVSTALDLGFVQSFIPALFGLEQRGAIGWAIHLATGALLGLVFALIVSRDAVVPLLVPDPDPDDPNLGPASVEARLTGAGLAYGLAIWALLPTLLLPLWIGTFGGQQIDQLPGTAIESLAAHVVFGVLLGAVFALVAWTSVDHR